VDGDQNVDLSLQGDCGLLNVARCLLIFAKDRSRRNCYRLRY